MTTPIKSPVNNEKIAIDMLPELLVGHDTVVPTLTGSRRYINFDNAASTPTFAPIVESVNSFLRWYSNVHRGTGFKSQLASWAFEHSRDIVAEFIGADLNQNVVIFTKNSTEAINKLANRLNLAKTDIILTTLMEHHSNELPWRRVGQVVHVGLKENGQISRSDFLSKLKLYGDRVKIVAITGASNVSGYINDIDFFAKETHQVGAKILVDGAQLVPHRRVQMKSNDPVHKIDFLVFSAHKMYAPFGVGVLVGERETFEKGDPESVGGGVVDIVTLEEAYWTELPEKEEAGTPDIIGVVALAKAIKMLESVGWDEIIRHEAELTRYALERLNKIENVVLYGDKDPANAENRLGVVSMNLKGIPHALTAAILSYEGAIGVRSGCFCAHLYVKSLLNVSEEDSTTLENEILARDRSNVPGTIRASFGIYNTKDEIDHLIAMIQKIASGDYRKDYLLNKEKGEYYPPDFEFNFPDYFSI
ncbi:MAG: aminotransferase class V-fold PLP-dependent enzyme [bacterium]|nr:aminotransferase class V-fold PLP-dependent enzyme [bacterium]